MNSTTYDILIIGGGPMGIATAIEAKKHNLSCIIIEKGALVNALYHFPKQMQFFSTSQKLEIGEVPFMSIKEKPLRDEALEYYRRVVLHWQLNIKLYEEVIELERDNVNNFIVKSSKNTYKAKNIVVAIGFYEHPNQLNILGENLPKVSHYYTDAHQYLQQKVAIIGAGNSACQVALELYHKGIDVTMIVRKPTIKPTIKYWIKPNIENRIKEGSIKAYFNTNVTKITENSLEINQNGQIITIENDAVLALTGYQPNYRFLKSLGITIDNDVFLTPTHNEENQLTNIKNMYLAGVVCGGLKTNKFIIESSKIHAVKIIKNVLKQKL